MWCLFPEEDVKSVRVMDCRSDEGGEVSGLEDLTGL
jgi:hypothetical protein